MPPQKKFAPAAKHASNTGLSATSHFHSARFAPGNTARHSAAGLRQPSNLLWKNKI